MVYQNLHTVMAELITHPNKIEDFLIQPQELWKIFNLSPDDKNNLIKFINSYGKRFLCAAKLLKKKRSDDIKKTLPLLSIALGKDKMDLSVSSYIDSLTYNNIVPKNPLMESLNFLEFITGDIQEDTVINQLIKYEHIKNKVIISYGQDTTKYNTLIENDINSKNLNNYNALIHPSYQIYSFLINISELVKSLNIKSSYHKNDFPLRDVKENILFYKNWKKGGVSTLLLNDVSEKYLRTIAASSNLQDLYSTLSKINQEFNDKFFETLITLKKLGVVTFIIANPKE